MRISGGPEARKSIVRCNEGKKQKEEKYLGQKEGNGSR
jgi:hypothetical protein